MIFFLILLALFLVYYGRSIAEKWKIVRHSKRLTSVIPGDEGLPIIGNFFEIGRDPESGPRILLEKAKSVRANSNEEMVKVWVLHECTFFIFTGNMLQYILESKDEINKGRGYGFFEAWLGKGLLLSGGDRWRGKRRLLTPSFHFNMLLEYIETMNRHSKILITVLENHIGKEFNIYPFMKRFTLDVICDAAMGKDLDSLNQPDQPYAKAISKLMYLGVKGTVHPHLWTVLGRWITGWKKEHEVNLKIAHDFTMKVIEERMEILARGDANSNKKAFLDLLILEKDRSNLSMLDIREEVDTFMFAGHDTTSSALGWTIWCLANHQQIQQQAYEEVHGIFGDDLDRDCTKEDIARLTYLERCIKESLRLFPPVPFVGRNLENDMLMGPHLLPCDSTVVIPAYLVHRNERIYPNPEMAGRHPYDYIPFSAGPRNCIGQRFAMNQLKIVISWLLRRYRFRTDRDFNSVPILAEVVLKAGGGVNVIIERR